MPRIFYNSGGQYSEVGKIINMFIQAQNTNSKECISCKRILNYEFFGHSKTSKDSFNQCCRNCRNQARRLQYGSQNEELHFNLRKNNDIKIPVTLCENTSCETNAILTNDLTRCYVRIKTDDCIISYEIHNTNSSLLYSFKFFIPIDRVQFFEKVRTSILNDLSARSMRLYDTEDELTFLTEY